jgi:hypothetical protein
MPCNAPYARFIFGKFFTSTIILYVLLFAQKVLFLQKKSECHKTTPSFPANVVCSCPVAGLRRPHRILIETSSPSPPLVRIVIAQFFFNLSFPSPSPPEHRQPPDNHPRPLNVIAVGTNPPPHVAPLLCCATAPTTLPDTCVNCTGAQAMKSATPRSSVSRCRPRCRAHNDRTRFVRRRARLA